MDTWEYVTITSTSRRIDDLTRTLNNAGAKGWELVAVSDKESAFGDMGTIVAVVKRKIVPFADPAETSSGWKIDPSERHAHRYWDGESWTFNVQHYDGSEQRDPPTQLTPAERDQ